MVPLTLLNLQTTVRGPIDPAALLTSSQKVIIVETSLEIMQPEIVFSLAYLLYHNP